ncbi:MAG: hypothetical protein ABIG71_01400, partial [Candidatus Uhrbacteria bacterium]
TFLVRVVVDEILKVVKLLENRPRVEHLVDATRVSWYYAKGTPEKFYDFFKNTLEFLKLEWTSRDVAAAFKRFGESLYGHLDLVRGAKLSKVELYAMVDDPHFGNERWRSREISHLGQLIRRFRGRVDPTRVVTIAAEIGIRSTGAYIEYTDDIEVVRAAERLRSTIHVTVPTLIRGYCEACRICEMDLSEYVTLRMIISERELREICEAFPDAALLIRLLGGNITTLEVLRRMVARKISLEGLQRYGERIVAILERLPSADVQECLDVLAWTDSCVLSSVRLLELPESARASEHFSEFAQMRGVLRDRFNEDLFWRWVAKILSAELSVSVELLDLCMQRDVQADCDGLLTYALAHALARRRVYVPTAVSLAQELQACYSRKRCWKGVRDNGYLASRLLGETPRQPDEGQNASELRKSGKSRTTMLATEDQQTDEQATDQSETIDVQTIHKQLDLSDVVPDRIDAVVAARAICYGFGEFGKNRPFVGERYLPVQAARDNVRRHTDDPIAAESAWQWLVSIGIINLRKSGDCCSLDLRDRKAYSREAKIVAQRVRKLFYKTRKATNPY